MLNGGDFYTEGARVKIILRDDHVLVKLTEFINWTDLTTPISRHQVKSLFLGSAIDGGHF